MNKIKILLLMLVLAYQPLRSQTVSKELQKIRSAYMAAKQLSFDVEVYSYAKKTDKTSSLVAKGYVKKNDAMYYSSFKNYELLVKGEKALIVDSEEKKMTYYEYKISNEKVPQAFRVNMDSVFSTTDSVIVHPVKDGVRHFTSFSKNGYIRQTELYVDAQTNLVKHILYYYVESTDDFEMQADRVEIFYKNIQTSGVDPHFFTFDKYFKNVKSAYVPSGKYQGYKLKRINSKS